MISIIICSVDSTKFFAVAATFRKVMGDEPYEFIRIPNAKSLAEGYNRGMRQSKGSILIFCHDDIEILSGDFVSKLKNHLETFDGIGIAGTTKLVAPGWLMAAIPYIFGQIAHLTPGSNLYRVCCYGAPSRTVANIQAMDGVFLAFRRPVIEAIGWDEQNFDGFHLYDIDCTYRAFLGGYKLGVVNDIPLVHFSSGKFKGEWEQYAERFLKKHAGRLPSRAPRVFGYAHVQVATRNEIIEVMSPPHWERAEPTR
jgi:GT2 family glycosyltransferase